jgi:hypothetical protein
LQLALAVNWGDVPDWITTAGGLFALIFVATVAITAHRVYLIESQRDKINAGSAGGRRRRAVARKAADFLSAMISGQAADVLVGPHD